jgi:RNA polymerase sigma factor (sigma-70 family)
MFETIAPLRPDHKRAWDPLASAIAPHRRPLAAPSLEEAYDAGLLAEVARWGDHAAFERIYLRYVKAVKTVAMQVCHSKPIAEEVAQHTFMALWQRAEHLASSSVRLRPWLTTVARNAAIDYLRSGCAAVVPLADADQRPAEELGPEGSALAGESTDELRRALATLSAEQREVIELVYFQGVTFQAASDATGEPLGTVKSRVRLALKHLRDRMAGTTSN